jgi:hypothetical protein
MSHVTFFSLIEVVLCHVSNTLAIVFAKIVDLCKKKSIEKLPIKLV